MPKSSTGPVSLDTPPSRCTTCGATDGHQANDDGKPACLACLREDTKQAAVALRLAPVLGELYRRGW